MSQNPYLSEPAVIEDIIDETSDTKTFTVRPEGKQAEAFLNFIPGQFLLVSLFGFGEAPISISSAPGKAALDLSIRKSGRVTAAVHRLRKGDTVWIRGPYGNGFDAAFLSGAKDLLFVAGGIGLAPLRGLIEAAIEKRRGPGNIFILYGARTPEGIIFKRDLEKWKGAEGVDLAVTVDEAAGSYAGRVGVVTTLLSGINIDPAGSAAVVCGPPVMIKYSIYELEKMGISSGRIITTLERYMKCGIGKCGHCNINHKYVCTDGPVFTYSQLKELDEAFA